MLAAIHSCATKGTIVIVQSNVHLIKKHVGLLSVHIWSDIKSLKGVFALCILSLYPSDTFISGVDGVIWLSLVIWPNNLNTIC